jgi:hypothetical protein
MANIINQYGQVKLGVRYVSAPLTSSYLLDTYSGAAAAYSLRKLRAAYTGAAIRVRRSSDNTTLDVGFKADGTLDTTAMLSFVGAGNGFVSIWYDQSGNSLNMVQDTSVLQPTIVTAGSVKTDAGKPALIFNQQRLSLPSVNMNISSLSLFYVGNSYGQNANYGGLIVMQSVSPSDNPEIRFGLQASTLAYWNGGYAMNANYGMNVTKVYSSFITGNTTIDLYGNNTLLGTGTRAGTLSNIKEFTLGGYNLYNGYQIGYMSECIVYTTNQTTNRTDINTNINSFYSIYATDVDAQAFITAAAITDSTQQTAINTLVTNLKTAGIWTKMKAIYPFVGGTAAQHRFNLKDPRTVNEAFYLTFNGGGTHSATGYQPNGNSYANTQFSEYNNITNNDTQLSNYSHLSVYSRTNAASTDANGGIGVYDYQDGYGSFMISIKRADGLSFAYSRGNAATTPLVIPDSRGFFLVNRQSNSLLKYSRNNELIGQNTTTINNGATRAGVTLGAVYDWGRRYYDNKEEAFASIGFSLTDVEATALYNAVQTYQTTLGRAV